MFSVLMFPHSTAVSEHLTLTVKRQIKPQCEHKLILQRACETKIYSFYSENETKPFRNKARCAAKRDLIRKSYFMVCFRFNFSLVRKYNNPSVILIKVI